MVFFEACLPSARRFFHMPLRFPIADAHYAMGFAFLFESTGDPAHLDRARRYLIALRASRCKKYESLLGLPVRLGHPRWDHHARHAADHDHALRVRGVLAGVSARLPRGMARGAPL